MSSQNAKILFCEAINSVYGEEHKVTDDDDTLFYSAKAGPAKYPGIYNISLNRSHPAYKLCLCMKSGTHKNSSKNRTYTVNVNSGAVWQKCWSKQCMQRDNRGRMALMEPESEPDSEDESEDEDAEATFTTTKKRKCM